MCGRYYIDEKTEKEIEQIIDNVEATGGTGFSSGEIYPSMTPPVITSNKSNVVIANYKWGFSNYSGKGLVINARAETVLEKRTFKHCLENGRCIIPASGFYEWTQNKEKHYFVRNEEEPIYMAGIYQSEAEQNHFVILTTAPNESIVPYHHRMPLIIEKDMIHDWLFEKDSISSIINHKPSALLTNLGK